MKCRTTPIVLGLVAVTFTVTGCSQNEPAGGAGGSSTPPGTVSQAALREVTLNLTGMT